MSWFEVDKKGLQRILAARSKDFVLFELVQNAWDEAVTRVDVTLERIAGTANVRLTVEDDSPDGFADLRHTYMLFAESAKKTDAGKRGRFNAGEKLALSVATEASIFSTKGGVLFDSAGRHVVRTRRERGSQVQLVIRMTTGEMEGLAQAAQRLLPPPGVVTTFNGVELASRQPLVTLEATLPTEIASADGNMTRTRRKTTISIYEPAPGTPASIYEMGIPIVETGDRWSVDIGQKVPLAISRDNVTPAYLAEVRAIVVEHMTEHLVNEDANSTWVRGALQAHGDRLPVQTIERLATLRFGEKRVSYDPSDPEANLRAAAQGYTVVHGGNLGRTEWDAMRRAGAIAPAGQVTPSARPYFEDGEPMQAIQPDAWTPAERAVVDLFERLAPKLVKGPVQPSKIVSDITWPFAATYGPTAGLTLNRGRLGRRWFEGPRQAILDLFLHELGHHFELSHLSPGYHDALTRLGGQLAELALSEPDLFRLDRGA